MVVLSVGLLGTTPTQTIPKDLWGRWIVRRVLPATTISCWGEDEAKSLIGTEIEYSAKFFRWKEVDTNNPVAEVTVISAGQFHDDNSGQGANSSQVSFNQLGIKADKAIQVMIQHPPASIAGATSEIPGDSVLIKDKNTIVFSICNVYFEAKRIAAPTQSREIRMFDFRESVYPWDEPSGVPSMWRWMSTSSERGIRLNDGRYSFHESNPPQPEPEGAERIQLTSITYGDLNGDGKEEAAVALNYGSGGTANWDYVYIYSYQRNVLKLMARLESGSRADNGLVRVSIENGNLVLDFADPERRVGDCCSMGFIRSRFRWQKGRFVEVGPREHGDLKLEVH